MYSLTNEEKTRLHYIIADHFRASCFIIADGVQPSGKQRGYVLRRLIRRMLMASHKLGIDITNQNYFQQLAQSVSNIYSQPYPEILANQSQILTFFNTESQKFVKAIQTGQKEWQKYLKNNSTQSTDLAIATWNFYQTNGVPIEVSQEIIEQNNLKLDIQTLNQLIEEHQKLSQTTSTGQFKSGLGQDNQKTRALHTTTHILHQVLRNLYGDSVRQMGSQITEEKARFDIALDQNLDKTEMDKIQSEVQKIIDKHLTMTMTTTSIQNAKAMGAIGLFGEKYPDIVSVYTLQDNESGQIYSIEFCGGPHIQNSSQIGKFKLIKTKSIGQGLKRLEFNIE